MCKECDYFAKVTSSVNEGEWRHQRIEALIVLRWI